MAFNLLTTKTNLDEYFLFVELDQEKVKDVQESEKEEMAQECALFESDLQNLIKNDPDF